MRDLVLLINAEQKTLFRGLILSFFVILPFTFIPTLLKHGLIMERIGEKLPDSIFYATCFALVIVIAAVIQNYNSLAERKRLFDKPAFVKLDFYGRLDGVGSIVKELETFLLGKVGDYYYRLNLVNPDQKPLSLEVIPLIDVGADATLIAELKQVYGFEKNDFFGQMIEVTEADLEDEDFLLERLTELSEILAKLQVRQLDLSDIDLD